VPERAAWLALGLLVASAAQAYGPDGHLIAGRAAAPLLCMHAADEVARLGGGQDLGELGLWADQIRSDPKYAAAAPWHYMNLDDGARIEDFRDPPEGDVLWAIRHFSERLGDAALPDAERAEALKFLVHFVVDLHQPLHVGKASDRGGNAILIRFRGKETNLHRLWDTNAIEQANLSVADYVAMVERIRPGIAEASLDPKRWAAEDLALRNRVYDFGREGAEPPARYLDFAADVTRKRLALAAVRLAGTLNTIFCAPR
jgi:nuclease S1